VMKKLLLLVVPVLLSGCATKVAFTPNLIEEYHLDGDALKDLQFYTSDKIVLTRAVTNEVVGKEDHHLERIADRYVEVVTIDKDTPCRVKEIGDDAFTVCFEEGGLLTFANQAKSQRKPYKEHTSGKNTNPLRLYRLVRDGKSPADDAAFFEYGPHMYMYQTGQDGVKKEFASFNHRDVYLKVDRDSVEHLCKSRRNPKGCAFASPCAKK